MTRLLRGLSDIASGYRLILCDVWGVVHNGVIAFERADSALQRFRQGGGKVVLITNSPNPSRVVVAQLDRLGVSRKAYDAIVSSGDVTASLVADRSGAGMFHIGPPDETALFDEILALGGKVPLLVPLKKAQFVLCTGLVDPFGETPADYDAILASMRGRDLELICANPDMVVEDGGVLFYCAGAIAERYAAAGGKVVQAGKPFAPIYERACELAAKSGNQSKERSHVLVIGDTLDTDIKGAHLQGFDSLFVTSGIHRHQLHGEAQDAVLDGAAFRQFMETADFMPAAAIPELVW
ncbi:MAG: TIGR01459 family HAD-type hydrolase [Beijerinckiaceae bacterium]|nr:TIGR01459 family HAD-type hydrolase [Beijerinckiaceae bacterium]MCI0736958.1 TIGR01459 family HAD-type hydrolase [Beijerinckiaceae bacterium]